MAHLILTRRPLRLGAALLALLASASALGAQDPKAPQEPKSLGDLFTDDEDGAVDLSEWLLSRTGFLAVPMLITEPAVGYGGGAGVVIFHEPPFQRGEPGKGQLLPPSVSFFGGGGTENGTWAAAGGHFHSWNQDDWRYLGVGGYAHVNLKFYGTSVSDKLQDHPVDYTLDGAFLIQEVQKRIAGDFRTGLRYIYFNTESEFEREPLLPNGITTRQTDSETAGLGLLLSYDDRNNVLTPTAGLRFDLRPQFYDEALGGDFQYMRVDFRATGHLPLAPFILAMKVDFSTASGDIPFYHLPWIQLRGVPAARYLGEHTVAVEGEAEWCITTRWSVVAFGGAGRAEIESEKLDAGSTVYAGGGGFRYLIARAFGLKAGIDIGGSSDGDVAFYIVLGGSWW
jgi:hypothetical protein